MAASGDSIGALANLANAVGTGDDVALALASGAADAPVANGAEPEVDRTKHPSGIVPVLQNVVATVNLGCKLDLKEIALHARNAEYNPKVEMMGCMLLEQWAQPGWQMGMAAEQPAFTCVGDCMLAVLQKPKGPEGCCNSMQTAGRRPPLVLLFQAHNLGYLAALCNSLRIASSLR